jgi:hypothetical protein
VIAIIGVRRGNNVLYAVRRSHTAHLFSHFPRLWPVVYLGKNVTMNVNHRLNSRQQLMDRI